MIYDFFINNLWASITVWVLLSLSDSYLTVAGSKLYHNGANKHFLFPGGYEIEPFHQQDVIAFKVVSFGYILSLILYGGLLWIIYSSGLTNLFAFIWGGLIFTQISVHLRHFRNLLVFSFAKRSRGVKGQIEYDRWLGVRMSSSDFFGDGLLLLIGYLFTSNLIILGGVAGCNLIAVRHWLMSKKEESKEEALDSSSA